GPEVEDHGRRAHQPHLQEHHTRRSERRMTMEGNEYLQQVVAEQARCEDELRPRKAKAAAPMRAMLEAPRRPDDSADVPYQGSGAGVGQAVDYRITGWFFK